MTDDPGPRQQRELQQHYAVPSPVVDPRCACGRAWPCSDLHVKAPGTIAPPDCPSKAYHGSWRCCPICGHQPTPAALQGPSEGPRPHLAAGRVHKPDASGLWCTCGERWLECAPRQATAPALAADRLDPVAYTPSEAEAVHADVTRMANVGAALVYAIYHSGADAVLALPPAVLNAYAAACKVYRVGASDA